MKKANNVLVYLFVSIISLVSLHSCKGKIKGDNSTVNVRLMGDPGNLNLLNASSIQARVIDDLIFMSLTAQETSGAYGHVPILIKELVKVSEIKEGEFKGGMKLEMEFKSEAKWDNGTPITGHDYVFTMKTILNPKTNCEQLKTFYEWIGDIVVDSANPKKITVYSSKKYFKIEDFACSYILPEYNYDPNHLMQKFTIRDMNTNAKREALKANNDIVAFADEFNSEKYQRDPKFISGMGPYKLESWTTGKEVVLVRKENWWGDQFKDQRAFWAFPKKMKFKVINDQSAAIAALKNGDVDFFPVVPVKEFDELKKNEKFLERFNLEEKDWFYHNFLCLNNRLDKFKDVNVRKALTLAVDRDKINKLLYDGKFQKAISFVHPVQNAFNKNMTTYEFNLEESKKLLDNAGWKDSDGDGIRDKMIKGRKVPFTIEFKYNSGNEQRKNTALILKEDFKKIGIQLDIVAKEFTVIQKEIDELNFEMNYMAFSISPNMSDPKQLWHTENAIAGGDNKCGFGNKMTDQLIDQLDQELDVNKRNALYLQLQQIIHDECPVIYLFYANNRIAYSKKFKVETHMVGEGANLNEFAPAN